MSPTLSIELYLIGKPKTVSSKPVPTPYENNLQPMNEVPVYMSESPKLIPLSSNTSNRGG